MRDKYEFMKAALHRPFEVSTIFPTSRFLAESLLDHADLSQARSVAELGPGTGAITRHLRPRLGPNTSYLGIEINDSMVKYLREKFPELRFEQGAAENLARIVTSGSIDAVVSSLPWTIFPDEMQINTLQSIHTALKPGGVFVTYVCVNALLYPQASGFLSRLKQVFSKVERSQLEWLNIPPAFVYKSVK